MALGLVMTITLIALFLLVERGSVEGLAGGVKGQRIGNDRAAHRRISSLRPRGKWSCPSWSSWNEEAEPCATSLCQ